MYSTNFTVDNTKICLSLHYNGDSSYLFVSGKEIMNFKAKNSEIVGYPLCLGGLSKYFGVGYVRATGLTEHGLTDYDFSIDYWAIANDIMLDIHKYLIKKNNERSVKDQ